MAARAWCYARLGAESASRDRILRLARAVRAATEVAELLGQEHGLVTVAPADEEALLAELLEPGRLRGGGRERRVGRRPGAGGAGAGEADRPVRQDALVPVAPFDAERVAPDFLQPIDAGGLGRAGCHRPPVGDARPGDKAVSQSS